MDNLPETIESKEDALVRLLPEFDTVKEAALAAGYSESMAKSKVYNIVKSAKFQKKLRDHYIVNNSTLLPKIAQAEGKLLNIILKDPEKLSKHNNTVKQMKQAAGILEPDNQPKSQVINIKSIKELSVHLQAKRIEQQVQDADVIDIEA